MSHRNGAGQRHAGFSLIELMIALVVTLIVSGAIFGLLASGQNAFRREPEVTERQQNIRVSMDLIQRDIAGAGMGMWAFAQAFTDTDGAGPLNNAGPPEFPSVINDGENTDYLEILTNDGLCRSLGSCGTPGTAIFTKEPLPACMPLPGFVYVYGAGGPAPPGSGPPGLRFAFPPPGGGGSPNDCRDETGGKQGHLDFQPGHSPVNPPGGCGGGNAFTASDVCEQIAVIQVVRYEIAADPSDGTPALWRSTLGRTDPGGGAGGGPPLGAWQLIARGVEDLQVEYLNGNGAWADSPGLVDCPPGLPNCTPADYATIVQQVRVTLSARTLTPARLAGESASAAGTAIRGQLTSVSSPRAALLALSQANPPIWQ